MNHLTEEQLTLVYFREAGGTENAHLEHCAECRASLHQLARFLDSVRAVPIPEKGSDFEQQLWSSIEPRVSKMLQRRGSGFRYWVLAPVLAGMLAIAFFAGMYTQHRFTPETTRPISARSRERVLLIALGDHLERSQLVLAELVNAPESKQTDISGEQQLAGRLVTENRLLRQTATRDGDNTDAAVLDQLERVLVDIAHSPSEVSSRELDELRERIEAQGLLFKVRVISTNAREKGMKL